jgi:pimeloyl-ACP methyl ester carboxylesterase
MTPVLFLHGAGMDHTVWRHQTRWLAARGREVAAPDLPGHGPDPVEPLRSVEDMAVWAARHADRPTVVAGHSMGALVALELAATQGLAVAGLVLVGAVPRMGVHPGLLRAAHDDLPLAARLIGGWSFPTAFTGGNPEPGTWQSGATTRLVEASRPGVLALDLEACVAYDAAARAPRVTTPTLVVSGRADRMTPSRQVRTLTDAIAGARFVTLDGVGHEPMTQDPRLFNTLVSEHLARVDALTGAEAVAGGKTPQH